MILNNDIMNIIINYSDLRTWLILTKICKIQHYNNYYDKIDELYGFIHENYKKINKKIERLKKKRKKEIIKKEINEPDYIFMKNALEKNYNLLKNTIFKNRRFYKDNRIKILEGKINNLKKNIRDINIKIEDLIYDKKFYLSKLKRIKINEFTNFLNYYYRNKKFMNNELNIYDDILNEHYIYND